MIAVIASHQVLLLRRQRALAALIGTLVVMTALAGVIGWSSHNTIVKVYDEATKLLASTGQPAPANPFILKPQLSLLSNMVVYIPLIGALLAVVLGHLSLADDASSGTGRLLFSRRVSRSDYVAGKVVAVGMVLAAMLAASFLVSAASLPIVNRQRPSIGELGRLVGFYSVSWLYLMIFALIGMIAVLVSGRRSLALLSAMGAWLVITFAVPQFVSGLRPTQSLNPITDPVSTSQTFFRITAKARPFSVVEQYKEISGRVLQLAAPESFGATLARLAPIVGLTMILGVALVALARRHDYSQSGNNQ